MTEGAVDPRAATPFRREIELDFIRGIAILLVLDFHDGLFGLLNYPLRLLHSTANPGWMGVDIFFVLSGFLVGGLLVKEWRVKGRIDSKSFLIRRCFKIWPQYYVYLFLMILSRHRTPRQLWGNLVNIQNYTGGIAHTWSLAVEEHAYLIIVFILAVAARRRVRMRALFGLFLSLAVLVVMLSFFLSAKGFDVFPTTHTRVDGIFLGVLLAILYHYAPDAFHRMQTWRWLWILFIVAALAIDVLHPAKWWFASASFALADLTGVGLLMLLYRHREGRKRSALYRGVAWVGLYSYGIYLWHVSAAAPIEAAAPHLPTWAVPAWVGVTPLLAGILLGVITTKLGV